MSREKKPSDWDDLQRMLSGDDASADAAAESEPKKKVKSKKQDDRKAKASKKKPAADPKKVEEALASVSRESLSADKVDTMLATAAEAVAPKKSRAPNKKIIDGQIFVDERRIPLCLPEGGEIGICERPLRAQTMQGERVALAKSESVPVGTTFEITVSMLNPDLEDVVREWLDYGALRGIGQWRNSGMGRIKWEEVK